MKAFSLSRSAPLLAGLGLSLLIPATFAQEAAEAVAIRSGKIWPDTDGKPVNAHGGGILFHQGTYYWYGEIKEGKTYLPDVNKSWGGTRVDVTGVSCYSSKNLIEWKNEGNVLPASDDPKNDLHKLKVLERPKVIYNNRDKLFVMWFHVDSMDYAEARCGVAVSESPEGPFRYQRSFRPNAGKWPVNATDAEKADPKLPFVRDHEKGQMARDMTVFMDDDGTAYLFTASEENATMHVSMLTEDYLDFTGKWARIFPGREMEAPAVFKHDGKYYIIASGCTAWAPNAARSAVADSIMGPWKELGNPARGEQAEITFQSQGTHVLPVAGKRGQLIFMADRWMKDDLPDSRYIWLPLGFEEGKPVARWMDSWKVE